MYLVKFFEVSLGAYLLGSIPWGYLAGKICKKDLRREGSGNIGATNAMRVLGKKWGYLVFAADFLKGAVAVVLASEFSKGEPLAQREALGLVVAILAILGHNFPIWLGFKGGKGIAVTAGVTLTLFPWPVFATALITWGIVFFTTRYVSLASIVASLTVPFVCFILFWFGKIGPVFTWAALGICMLAIWRHRSNISRLMAGTESRFTKKTKD